MPAEVNVTERLCVNASEAEANSVSLNERLASSVTAWFELAEDVEEATVKRASPCVKVTTSLTEPLPSNGAVPAVFS